MQADGDNTDLNFKKRQSNIFNYGSSTNNFFRKDNWFIWGGGGMVSTRLIFVKKYRSPDLDRHCVNMFM